ncbi:large subunit ribosomal protein L25 [Evansella vedderi]|uniref:Large ribosomal subunit protein bL25 n=1 Tax=Evansella vedderi TaxID=38282 RepID=A0ABU0A4G5_9BACI|nr:50S ribosomal protein L25/general stress protein Ctc [Evansella vedderi]MDQ0257861.1 large subunit ribosomal protein L25 [Evansella vedderi]
MATVLQADKREDLRGSKLKRIRNQGGVPGVIYGKEVGNSPVTVEEVSLIKTIRENGRNGVLKLDINGNQTDVMISEIQVDPIKNNIVHVDFYAVDMKKEIDANVPVQAVGESIGVKNGGVLQQSLYEVSIRALPSDLPEAVEIDVSELDINDSLQVKDLVAGANYVINNDPEESVLSILPPTDVPNEQDAEGEDQGESEEAEPEVINESGDEAGNKGTEEE